MPEVRVDPTLLMGLINVPVTFQPQLNESAPLPRVVTVHQAQTSSLIDVQIQLQTQPTRRAPSRVLPQTVDENLLDVVVEENFTVDVPVKLLQTCGVPFSSKVLGKRLA